MTNTILDFATYKKNTHYANFGPRAGNSTELEKTYWGLFVSIIRMKNKTPEENKGQSGEKSQVRDLMTSGLVDNI